MTSTKTYEYPTMKHFLSWGGIVTRTGSNKCKESRARPSAEIYFSHQNVRSTGFEEFQSQQVLRYDCNLKITKIQCDVDTMESNVEAVALFSLEA